MPTRTVDALQLCFGSVREGMVSCPRVFERSLFAIGRRGLLPGLHMLRNEHKRSPISCPVEAMEREQRRHHLLLSLRPLTASPLFPSHPYGLALPASLT